MNDDVIVGREMKDKTVSHIFKLTVYFLARVILICLLSWMASPLTFSNQVMSFIIGVFYLFALVYFFILTGHHEGGSDRNRVEIGLVRENKAKGFISSAILIVPMLLVGAIPTLFMSGVENIFTTVLKVIYYIFSMSVMNLADIFVPDGGDPTVAFAVYAAVYVLCLICGGVAYKLGYEDKHPLKPISDKFASWKNS